MTILVVVVVYVELTACSAPGNIWVETTGDDNSVQRLLCEDNTMMRLQCVGTRG